MNKDPLLVLLVEDDMDLAATVADYLALEDIDCDHAYNGQAGIEAATNNRYDVVLLDLALPNIDGLTVCQTLRRSGLNCPILMLTARDTLSDKVAGFEAGTDDYLVKPFAFEELVVRIRALVRRKTGWDQNLAIGDLQIDFSERKARRAGRALRLTPTGWTLLETLSRNSPSVVTREQLERAVWGDDVPDSNSLKVHLYKLRRQIQRPHESKLLYTVSGAGFVLRET
ncbi:response regulator transcription factor [Roseibium sp. SCPC15]|jgi:DNA-binding response OmpR family regulator|uniref:response regulator transcription factor n=1 Tax=Roseibium sp. SCP15 TaxID=3141376 RepID=UPI003337DAAF